MMGWLNRLTTTLIILLVVAAPPAAVAVWLLHRPWRLPTIGDIRVWLEQPPPEAIVITVVGTGAVMLWLLITTIVLRTVIQNVRRGWQRLRRLPLPTPAQATASSLAGTALLGIPALGAAPDTPQPTPVAGAGQQHVDRAPTPHAQRENADRQEGVDLPDGGWIPQHSAENVAAMAGLFWLRRRQAYQPTTPASRDNPPVLPPAATAITAANPTLTADAVAGTGDNIIPADHLPAGDVTLTGPGAHAAARGLLVTALMTNTAIGTPRAHVVITTEDLNTLLAPSQAGLPQTPGLHVTDNPGAATVRLQSIATGDGRQPRQPVAPPRVLHLRGQRPGPSHGTPHPGPVDATLTTVAFGPAATGGEAWHVDTAGTLTSTNRQHRRLCVLSPQTACDLLNLISQAHGLAPASTRPASVDDEQPARLVHDPAADVTVPPARLTVLGDCRLTVQHHTVAIQRSAAWQTLVLLAAHRDGVTARQIIATIWPGLPPASITNRLYTTLSNLRTQLKPVLEQPLITHHADRYALDPTVVDVDLWHMQSAARAAAHAITTSERHHAHRVLITHHQGDLATGHTWPWLAPLREIIRHDVINAYADVVGELPAADAIQLLREAITVDPYNEDLHRRAISALIDLGDHIAAARLYQTYTHRLTTAGLRPSTHLNDLANQITTPT